MQITVGKGKSLSKLSSLFSTYRLTFKRRAILFFYFTCGLASDCKNYLDQNTCRRDNEVSSIGGHSVS